MGMREYTVIYTEKSIYRDEIEADSEEQAAAIWEDRVNSGEVDFSRMDLVDSSVRFDSETCTEDNLGGNISPYASPDNEPESRNIVPLCLNVTLTNDDIDDIMSAALDGGISYWCYRAEVVEEKYYGEYASDQISRGGSLRLYDVDGETYLLTKEKLLLGFQIAYNNGFANYDEWVDGVKVNTFNIDAEAADCIIQCAIWHTVVKG